MSNNANKRIAKNTIFLYFRMLLSMVISIFTVRIVLENLGIVDYGIYNVVGGLSSMFIFFQSALTNATQRFLNYEIGSNNANRLNQIFNLSLEIYSVIALIVLIIGIPIGSWLIYNKLTIPNNQLTASNIVLCFTFISIAFSFVGSVYEAVLISQENMKIYAYIGLFDAVSKLLVAYIIAIVPASKLIIYAFLLMVSGIIPKIILIIYCRRNYVETKIRYFWNKNLFREIFAFSGWNIYGTGVWMANQQGINIILNMFFGPVVNAARGVAFQITNVINNFAVNFFTAIRPQIIKTYASGELTEFTHLIFVSSRFSFYLIWIFSLPIALRIDYILSLWLVNVPEYSSIFVRWVLIYMLVDTFNNPLWSAIQAVGKLRKTILYGSSFFLTALPISYLFLYWGYKPWVVYPVLIVVRIIYLIIVYRILQEYVKISSKAYAKKVLLPIIYVCALSLAPTHFINNILPDDFISLIITAVISVVITCSAIITFGVQANERKFILAKITNVIYKIKGTH